MKKLLCPSLVRALLGAFLLATNTNLPAQPAPDAAVAASVQAMSDGLKFRGDLVTAIVAGADKSAEALVRLKAQASPSGLKIDADADFAIAAIDIGQRLIAAGKADEAEKFFQEAEKSLDQAMKKTPDSAARDKAQYLETLSFIRSQFLNNLTQARLDLDQAIALRPDDQKLRKTKDRLPIDPAEMLRKNPRG